MHLIDPRPQRQGTRGSVDGEVTDHLGGGGVDEDRRDSLSPRLGSEYITRVVSPGSGAGRTADSVESLPAITVFAASIWSASGSGSSAAGTLSWSA